MLVMNLTVLTLWLSPTKDDLDSNYKQTGQNLITVDEYKYLQWNERFSSILKLLSF